MQEARGPAVNFLLWPLRMCQFCGAMRETPGPQRTWAERREERFLSTVSDVNLPSTRDWELSDDSVLTLNGAIFPSYFLPIPGFGAQDSGTFIAGEEVVTWLGGSFPFCSLRAQTESGVHCLQTFISSFIDKDLPVGPSVAVPPPCTHAPPRTLHCR